MPLTEDDIAMITERLAPSLMKGTVSAILEIMQGGGGPDEAEVDPDGDVDDDGIPDEAEGPNNPDMDADGVPDDEEMEQPPAPPAPAPAMRRQGCGAPIKQRMGKGALDSMGSGNLPANSPIKPKGRKPMLRRHGVDMAAASSTNGSLRGGTETDDMPTETPRRMGREQPQTPAAAVPAEGRTLSRGERAQRLKVKTLEQEVANLKRYQREQDIRLDLQDLVHAGFVLDPEDEVKRLVRFSAEDYETELDRIVQRYQRNPDGGPAVPVQDGGDDEDAIPDDEDEQLMRFAQEQQLRARRDGLPVPEASDLIQLYRNERREQGAGRQDLGPARGERAGRPRRA